MPVRRIRLTVQFDGSAFQGWQRQAEGRTVQGLLEEAIAGITGQTVTLFGAGRTDSGVHALAMPAHFDIEHSIPAVRLPVALNHFLPAEVSVLAAEETAPDFDARRHALLRWYRYQILPARHRRPLGPRAWQVWQPLEIEALRAGLAMLEGDHDFGGFRSSQCQASRTRLTLERARLVTGREMLALDFKCRSFLHHMVRFMAGTVVAHAQGRLDEERLRRILEEGERPQLVDCAPPQGLCLMAVGYDDREREQILKAAPAPPSF